MGNSLEADYLDFIQIQGLKGQVDIAKTAEELEMNEEELFDFVNERVVKLEEQGFNAQNVGESLGTLFLFGVWLRGLKAK